MLAIDTDLVVRYLVTDDPAQAGRARKLIDNNDVFVCTTVMLETEWVLRSVYGFSPEQCADALTGFAGLSRVTLEDAAATAKALNWMRRGVDFADGLHLLKAEGCEAFISFDRNFARVANTLRGTKVRAPKCLVSGVSGVRKGPLDQIHNPRNPIGRPRCARAA